MSLGHLVTAVRALSNGARVDAWTGAHVAFGALAQRMGLTLAEVTALGVLNEAGEAWIRVNRPDWPLSGDESPQNIGVDIAANTAGWLLARTLG